MQTTISSKHIDITKPIAAYANKKAARLQRYFDRIQQIDLIIDKSRNGYTVEIITDVEHHSPFVATATDADMYACIDLGVDRASRQLKDHKSKMRDRKHVIPNSHTITPRASTARTRTATVKAGKPSSQRSRGVRGKRA